VLHVRHVHRRQAILAVVGAIAALWAVTAGSHTLQAAPAAIVRAASGSDSGSSSVSVPACPFPRALVASFRSAAASTGLPPALLYAVAKVESQFQIDARSSVGARGLLQVMPATAAAFDLDPDLPQTNVLAGARYLKLLVDRFGSVDTALAAYNAGPTAVAAAGGSAPSLGVVRYVANVDAIWHGVAGCR
jgi:soluble lytic murein transglycosylase-like protein